MQKGGGGQYQASSRPTVYGLGATNAYVGPGGSAYKDDNGHAASDTLHEWQEYKPETVQGSGVDVGQFCNDNATRSIKEVEKTILKVTVISKGSRTYYKKVSTKTLPCGNIFCDSCVVGSKHACQFCRDCLKKAAAVKPVCSICGVIFGVVTGTQPDGQMFYRKAYKALPGYEKNWTIEILYRFQHGRQKVNNDCQMFDRTVSNNIYCSS